MIPPCGRAYNITALLCVVGRLGGLTRRFDLSNSQKIPKIMSYFLIEADSPGEKKVGCLSTPHKGHTTRPNVLEAIYAKMSL
jgi:hypothetical protein